MLAEFRGSSAAKTGGEHNVQSIDKPRRLLTLLVSALALFALCSQMIAAQETVQRPRITGISHVGYFVSDLPRAIAFWHDFLGYDESYSLTKKTARIFASHL
jgi:catechol-2,3-dioxygenase